MVDRVSILFEYGTILTVTVTVIEYDFGKFKLKLIQEWQLL